MSNHPLKTYVLFLKLMCLKIFSVREWSSITSVYRGWLWGAWTSASNLESAAVVSSAKFQTSAYQIIFWCNQGGVLGLFQLNQSKKRFRIQFSFRKGWTIWYGLSHHALLSLSTSYFWIVPFTWLCCQAWQPRNVCQFFLSTEDHLNDMTILAKSQFYRPVLLYGQIGFITGWKLTIFVHFCGRKLRQKDDFMGLFHGSINSQKLTVFDVFWRILSGVFFCTWFG